MPSIFHFLCNNIIITIFFILIYSYLILIVCPQTEIKSLLNKKIDFIFSNFQNINISLNILNYPNKVGLNKINFLNLVELNKNRIMINDNTIEIKDCLVTFECNTILELNKINYLFKQDTIFEYNITKFHLSYNSDNKSFNISNLIISPSKYSLINEKIFKNNKEFINDINNTNGLFYNLTYNLTYDRLKGLCEDFDQLINDFFNVINISEKYLKEDTKSNNTSFVSFNSIKNQYYFSPIVGGILVNNVSFLLFNRINGVLFKCNFDNFFFGKNIYMHSGLRTNLSVKFYEIRKFIYRKFISKFDIIFKKSRNEYYGFK